MSKLLQQIKNDQLNARKLTQTAKAKILTTLIGEASPSGNGVVDDKAVLATIAKFLKNNAATQKLKPSEALAYEAEILEAYMPEKLTGSNLESYITRTIEKVNASSMRDMGKVMGKLKGAPYTIDMTQAQQLIKKLLA